MSFIALDVPKRAIWIGQQNARRLPYGAQAKGADAPARRLRDIHSWSPVLYHAATIPR